MAFLCVHAEVGRRDVPHCQVFLIFAYLRATADAVENNRFSVLKWDVAPDYWALCAVA